MIGLYGRTEMRRTLRNPRAFFFTLLFPLVMYVLIAGPARHEQIDGISAPLYFLSGMAAWGAMAAVLSSGARIAGERTSGWNRQLRITPLEARTYVATKLAGGYLTATVSMVVLSLVGLGLGVRLSPVRWVMMVGLILVGLLPFAGIGVFIGHRLSIESMAPAMGGITSVMAILGGTWGPVASHGWMHRLAESLPSYWLVQAGKVGQHASAWPRHGWVVVVVWTIVMARLAFWAFRRDTNRA
jgi:ABC-2 type transport system permease protein